MRIAINALYLLPGRVGGTETYIRNLVRWLARVDRSNTYVIFVNRESAGIFEEYLPPAFLYSDTSTAAAKLESAGTLLGQHRECSGAVRDGMLAKHSPQRFAGRVHSIVTEVLESGPGVLGRGRRPCG